MTSAKRSHGSLWLEKMYHSLLNAAISKPTGWTPKYKNVWQFLLNSDIFGSPTKSSLPTMSFIAFALNMHCCCTCAISIHVNTMTFSNSNLRLCDDINVADVPWWPGLSAAVPPAAAGFRGTAEEPSWRLLLSSSPVWPPVTHTSPSNTGARPTQAAGRTAGRIAGIGGHGQNDIHIAVSYIQPQYRNKGILLVGHHFCILTVSVSLFVVWISGLWGFQRAVGHTDL